MDDRYKIVEKALYDLKEVGYSIDDAVYRALVAELNRIVMTHRMQKN